MRHCLLRSNSSEKATYGYEKVESFCFQIDRRILLSDGAVWWDKSRRDEVMQKTQSLWQQLSGTNEGWNDWAGVSSLSHFYAGSKKGNAWRHLASVRPKLVLTDALGHEWNPDDVSKKTTFVTLWASWCGPCRAELP
jgi:thiol-disulfide isomerase/thioredoxin